MPGPRASPSRSDAGRPRCRRRLKAKRGTRAAAPSAFSKVMSPLQRAASFNRVSLAWSDADYGNPPRDAGLRARREEDGGGGAVMGLEDAHLSRVQERGFKGTV